MAPSPPLTPEAMDVSSRVETEVDELESEFHSDTEDPNVFQVRDPLKEAVRKHITTQNLHTMIHNGEIDLNPPYQRDVVWPDKKQTGLIDSLFRNFYIPPVVFAMFEDADGDSIRECVDGKQRLTSIIKFIDGQLPHKDSVTKKSWWFTVPPSQKSTKLELPEWAKKQFLEKKITCVEYPEMPRGAERDLFQRVQLGMALTAAEKLQSHNTPWANWIRELERKHIDVEGGLQDVLQWDVTRGRDFQNIAHMVYCCDGLPLQRLPTAQKIETWISRCGDEGPKEQFKQDIEDALRTLWLLATTPEHNEAFLKVDKRLAPVEFIFIGVLLFLLRKQPLGVRAKAIFNLRRTIRLEYRDIRNNTDVGKSMWKYIDVLRVNPSATLVVNEGSPKKSAGVKRRRVNDAGASGDDEYKPRPAAKSSKPRAKAAR